MKPKHNYYIVHLDHFGIVQECRNHSGESWPNEVLVDEIQTLLETTELYVHLPKHIHIYPSQKDREKDLPPIIAATFREFYLKDVLIDLVMWTPTGDEFKSIMRTPIPRHRWESSETPTAKQKPIPVPKTKAKCTAALSEGEAAQ